MPIRTLFMIVFVGLLSFSEGLQAQEVAPLSVDGAQTIDEVQAKELLDQGALFIDLRGENDYAIGHIPGAKNLNIAGTFSKEDLQKLAKKDDLIVFYCYGISCLRSYTASTQAVGWGYRNIKFFRSGYPAWIAAGYPLETDM